MRVSSFGEGIASPEMEIAEGGAIVDNKARFADLKSMLDSSKDNLKVDAMKRIINMVAKGRDVSELFPAVVKNVVAKNLELKKLVFVYLVRYAEEQQDLALLSISTFQRALKDPNQLIRASALRVLSSIRVSMIVPIMLLAIRESVRDMSAYVRKVAAHAIPKLYALDEDLQPELIDCIDFLLGDKRTLVLGSAVYAFEETCPDRFDILHKHYRSLCKAIADVDEWGQVVMIGLLTRYARSQFVAPSGQMDPDHSLLLSSCRPLLQSRNCAVVMAVSQLFYHCAPLSQHPVISKALIRLLHGSREVQSIVLVNIATICANNPNMFEPFLKNFFVRPSEPVHIKLLKLQVLTSLVSETNVQLILRELQTYVSMPELASAAVEAIGQCALRVGAVSESCLSGLIALISSTNENVVSAAVIVLKKLLHSEAPLPLLSRVVRLIETMKASAARACVIWLIATHVEKVPLLAPDLLRLMARTFAQEDEIVKLQTMNLAVRLWLTDRDKCELLVQYVMQLARYDQSYDIRDRCRFLRNMLCAENKLGRYAKEIFLAEKPSPAIQSSFKDRDQFQLGSLSHLLNQRCAHYRDLPPFPEVAPDPSVRSSSVELAPTSSDSKSRPERFSGNEENFYSDEDEQEVGEEESEEEYGEGDEEDDDEDEEHDEESEEDEDEIEDGDEEEEDSNSQEGTDGHAEKVKSHKERCGNEKKKDEEIRKDYGAEFARRNDTSKNSKPSQNSNDVDLLLDLSFDPIQITHYNTAAAKYVESLYSNLFDNENWTVGISVDYRFARVPSSCSSSMCVITLKFVNRASSISPYISVTPQCIEGIRTSDAFDLEPLTPGQEKLKWIHIDFGDGKRSSVWNLKYEGSQEVSLVIDARMGEQIEPICMNTEEFTKEAKHLSGMNEHTAVLGRKVYPAELYKIANCNNVTDSEDDYCAQTLSKKQLVLISVGNELTVRCENYMLASFLCKEIESFFAREFSREPLAPNDEISQISHCRKTTEASLPQ